MQNNKMNKSKRSPTSLSMLPSYLSIINSDDVATRDTLPSQQEEPTVKKRRKDAFNFAPIQELQRTCMLLRLPDECLILIFEYAEEWDYVSLASTCHQIRHTYNTSEEFWLQQLSRRGKQYADMDHLRKIMGEMFDSNNNNNKSPDDDDAGDDSSSEEKEDSDDDEVMAPARQQLVPSKAPFYAVPEEGGSSSSSTRSIIATRAHHHNHPHPLTSDHVRNVFQWCFSRNCYMCFSSDVYLGNPGYDDLDDEFYGEWPSFLLADYSLARKRKLCYMCKFKLANKILMRETKAMEFYCLEANDFKPLRQYRLESKRNNNLPHQQQPIIAYLHHEVRDAANKKHGGVQRLRNRRVQIANRIKEEAERAALLTCALLKVGIYPVPSTEHHIFRRFISSGVDETYTLDAAVRDVQEELFYKNHTGIDCFCYGEDIFASCGSDPRIWSKDDSTTRRRALVGFVARGINNRETLEQITSVVPRSLQTKIEKIYHHHHHRHHHESTRLLQSDARISSRMTYDIQQQQQQEGGGAGDTHPAVASLADAFDTCWRLDLKNQEPYNR